jgi:DNA-binding NarL/FixJ family response regulator
MSIVGFPTPPDKPSILIIDAKKLRQAGIMHFLAAWAEATGLTIGGVASDSPKEKDKFDSSCEMVILSIGSASIDEPRQRSLIKEVKTRAPQAALVIISDREESEEIRSAFEAGAAGFMPTSIEPSVALQALSLIKCGGSFFPPSALYQGLPRTRTMAFGAPAHNGHDSRPHPSKLSAKQEEVFNLLRGGPSNKVIARQLGVSEATVKVHVRCIMRKLGVTNRTQLAIAAMGEGVLS